MYPIRNYSFAFALAAIALAGATVVLSGTAAKAQCFNGGVLRIRSGPGQGHPIVGTMPAGARVSIGQCVAPDDGVSQYQWCQVNYRGIVGWASACGLF